MKALILALLTAPGCASHNPCITLAQYRGSECAVSQLKCSDDVADGYFDCLCPDGTRWSWKVDATWKKRAER